MRRIIAHIGAHKTGTTAFQGWLQQHRQELLDAGYFVPVEGGTGNSAALAKALYLADRPQGKVERLFADAARHHSCDILLSAEHLGSVTGDDLKVVAKRFDEMASRKVAILVVRDPISHFNSGFAQRGKAMKADRPAFADFVTEGLERGRADWRRKVEEYEANGFEVRVLPYNAAFKAKGSPRAILELPDFGDLASRFDWSATAHGNASMGAIGLIIMDLMLAERGERAPETERRSPPELRQRVIKVATRRFADAPFNGFTPELRERVIEHYQAGNAWIAGRYFGAPWDEVLPPQPEQLLSPQSLMDLEPSTAADVRAAAAGILDKARRKHWL